MTIETRSSRPPAELLEAARDFFLGPDRMSDAWLDSESDTHLTFGTFRGLLSVAAFPDPESSGATLVRVTTLREEGIVPRLLKHLELASAGAGVG